MTDSLSSAIPIILIPRDGWVLPLLSYRTDRDGLPLACKFTRVFAAVVRVSRSSSRRPVSLESGLSYFVPPISESGLKALVRQVSSALKTKAEMTESACLKPVVSCQTSCTFSLVVLDSLTPRGCDDWWLEASCTDQVFTSTLNSCKYLISASAINYLQKRFSLTWILLHVSW